MAQLTKKAFCVLSTEGDVQPVCIANLMTRVVYVREFLAMPRTANPKP